ncbi:hypothetical protein J5289_28285 (plasmid) [Rhizobium sp. B230/85]|uniref:hypothetical protein n=1 Tax=unclassified Rhizobium TaxID=2613769 RepID=UPI001ADAFCEC|nr:MULTISPECIES: hypothetical protein [unclassified Rhizobium]MBO9136511.1 hypothetical protein [Rhizobium sp. B209b/85]QXZ99729.1 hypothetical protein J5289_28285 [Rhizobium sp. B230/85]
MDAFTPTHLLSFYTGNIGIQISRSDIRQVGQLRDAIQNRIALYPVPGDQHGALRGRHIVQNRFPLIHHLPVLSRFLHRKVTATSFRIYTVNQSDHGFFGRIRLGEDVDCIFQIARKFIIRPPITEASTLFRLGSSPAKL